MREGSKRSPWSRGQKWALGVGVAMWVCGFFVARVEGATRPEMSGASALFVVAFALPSYVSLWRWIGSTRALQVLVVLGSFAMAIETLAVVTGWPYGTFAYGDAIGGKVAGLVPWTVPFAWTPLVLGTHVLTQRCLFLLSQEDVSRWRGLGVSSGFWVQVMGATLALVLADLVLDPGAVRQGFWKYAADGLYYKVPASNYFGWLLSGLVGHVFLAFLIRPAISRNDLASHKSVARQANQAPDSSVWAQPDSILAPGGLATSLGWTVAFWASVCAWAGLWVPAVVGHAYLICLWWLLGPQQTNKGASPDVAAPEIP